MENKNKKQKQQAGQQLQTTRWSLESGVGILAS